MPIPSTPLVEPRMSARDRVYQTLRDWIIDGTLQPEEKLSDQEIAKYFSVSRTPVREAMQLLADQRLIEIFPGKESRIAPVDFNEIRQCYEIIAEIQVLALDFAFPKINKDVISELTSLNQEFDFSSPDLNTHSRLAWDSRFHQVFFRIAGNSFLTSFNSTLLCHIQRVESMYYSRNWDGSVSQATHQLIIDALKRGDRDSAREAMRSNWLSTLKYLNT